MDEQSSHHSDSNVPLKNVQEEEVYHTAFLDFLWKSGIRGGNVKLTFLSRETALLSSHVVIDTLEVEEERRRV